MLRFLPALLIILCASPVLADPAGDLIHEALAAEARLDTSRALDLFLQADRLRPDDPFILQKIARQYSDSVLDTAEVAEKHRRARLALDYSRRSVELDPTNPENVLSLAVSHGKLATYSDTRAKLEHSRIIKDMAERALLLDPDYDWAHHVLGRWHHEVASLGTAARLFVRLVYGGLPDASHEAAVRHLETAVRLAPDILAHHLELGFAYLATGRPSEARRAFEHGLALPVIDKHDASAKERARAALAELS